MCCARARRSPVSRRAFRSIWSRQRRLRPAAARGAGRPRRRPGTPPRRAAARPALLVANEFLDALPVRQFVRDRARLARTPVGSTARDRRLAFVAGGTSRRALAAALRAGAPAGTIAELCPAARRLCRRSAPGIAGTGGVALLIDYGDFAEPPPAPRCRRCAATRYAIRLPAPAQRDLTRPCRLSQLWPRPPGQQAPRSHGPVPQGTFLRALGIEARAAAAARAGDAGAAPPLRAAPHPPDRPAGMGEFSKCWCSPRRAARRHRGFVAARPRHRDRAMLQAAQPRRSRTASGTASSPAGRGQRARSPRSTAASARRRARRRGREPSHRPAASVAVPATC